MEDVIKLTAPLAAKSSPRSTVVPTTIKSLLPLSVLAVSRVIQAMSLIYSFVANSYLFLGKFAIHHGL